MKIVGSNSNSRKRDQGEETEDFGQVAVDSGSERWTSGGTILMNLC